MFHIILYSTAAGKCPTADFLDSLPPGPNTKMLSDKGECQNEFYGMSDKKFTYDNHIETLKTLINIVNSNIKTNYKDFLLDFVRLEHKFSDVDIPNLDKLPAIKWKVRNLEKLCSTNKAKFEEQAEKLSKCFE